MRARVLAVAVLVTLLAELAVVLTWSGTAAPALPAGRLAVWPLGDSLTLGTTDPASDELTSPGGYRPRLDALLTKAGISHRFVGTSGGNPAPSLIADGQTAHDGHPGLRIDQVLNDLTQSSAAAAPDEDGGHWLTGLPGRPPVVPDVVVILLGTNDIEQRFDPQTRFPTARGLLDFRNATQVSTFVADLTSRLGELVDAVERLHPGTAVVLSDVPPLGRYLVDPVSGAYARSVAALVARERVRGRNIVFADVFARFTEPSALSVAAVRPGMIGLGGIHPSAAGYAALADVYADAIRRLRRE